MEIPLLEKLRLDTPGCWNKLFFDSAGASLMPRIVVEKITDYLRMEEEIGGYELADQESKAVQSFYTEAAKLLGTQPYNIAFTYNATDSYARALSSIPFQSGDYILTTNDDYSSNQIAFLSIQKRFGINIERVNNLPNGDIDLDQMESLIKKLQPILVAVTHIPTNSGLIQSAEEIGALCRKYDIWYLLDACQSVGQIEIDVKKIDCDFLSATGRKFLRGPRGTGFLYLSDQVIKEGLEPLFIDMHGADWIGYNEYKAKMNAKRFELWEFSYSSLIGFTAAIQYANTIGLKWIEEYNQILIQNLKKNLEGMNYLQILDRGSKLGSILTFYIHNRSLQEVESILRQNKIYYTVSTKTGAFIDFSRKGIEWAIRLSPHYFNTDEEINAVSEILKKNFG